MEQGLSLAGFLPLGQDPAAHLRQYAAIQFDYLEINLLTQL